MRLVVLGHGQNRNLGDGAFGSLNPPGSFIHGSQVGIQIARIAPVSYTHLDVYKRQDNDRSAGLLPDKFSGGSEFIDPFCKLLRHPLLLFLEERDFRKHTDDKHPNPQHQLSVDQDEKQEQHRGKIDDKPQRRQPEQRVIALIDHLQMCIRDRIDILDLEANPRSSATGPVTAAIQESIENDPETFPFKTKGILLASSQYERLDRGRIKITPDNLQIEGILDGGHNTLAIGWYLSLIHI